VFYSLLQSKEYDRVTPLTLMGGVTGSRFLENTPLCEVPVVVFDFETTGLNPRESRIIEIGAIKFIAQKEVARFSQLIDPGVQISSEITRITGITNADLAGKPPIPEVLPAFHDFLRGAVGIAHNAEFDISMLHYESLRLGITCEYTVFCTLKMARVLLAHLERKNLDTLAKHYNLTFEERHRSIGDILVTAQVLWNMWTENPHIKTIADMAPYRENMLK
jgi:DNA polymerase III epsilon subunit family exonuclease